MADPRLTAPKMICLAIRIAGLAGGWARRDYGRITPVWSSSGGVMRPSVGDPNSNRTGAATLLSKSLARGRTWWAHLEFEPAIIALTFHKEKIEENLNILGIAYL